MKHYRIDAPLDNSVPQENRGLKKTIPTQAHSPLEKPKATKDPLIAGGWEKGLYGLAFALAMGTVLIISFMNKRLEQALIFALILSAIAIFIFFAV